MATTTTGGFAAPRRAAVALSTLGFLREAPLADVVRPVSDPARLRSIVDDQFGFVYRALRAFGLSPPDAEDASQEVFVIVSRKLDLVTVGSERAYLFATARGVASNVRRAASRRRDDLNLALQPDALDESPDPERAFAVQRARRELTRIMDAMDDDARVVFMLFELEELTVAEVAIITDTAPGTVASRLRRARELFQRETDLMQEGGDE